MLNRRIAQQVDTNGVQLAGTTSKNGRRVKMKDPCLRMCGRTETVILNVQYNCNPYDCDQGPYPITWAIRQKSSYRKETTSDRPQLGTDVDARQGENTEAAGKYVNVYSQ